MTATAQSPLSANHPLMLAWEAYKATDEYANTKRWASHPEHAEGSLWAAFVAGSQFVSSASTACSQCGVYIGNGAEGQYTGKCVNCCNLSGATSA